MTDYIISDNWLLELVSDRISDARKREIEETIRSRPLSSALKAERDKLIDKFAERFRSSYIFFDDVKFDETIESLRSEQP